jgi:four helix bundle protein
MIIEDKIKFREQLKLRLKDFVIELIRYCQKLPRSEEAIIIKRQLLRSANSAYANYRAANRARSKAEFFSQISIEVEEADETEMWIDLLRSSGISESAKIKELHGKVWKFSN